MKKTNPLVWSVLLAGIFAAMYLSVSLQKYSAHLFRGDITAYAQGLWNTLHGHPFASTFNYSVHEFWGQEGRTISPDNSSILGIHFNAILLAFVPFYALFPSPKTLLVMQAGVLAASSIFIYLIARRHLHKPILAFLIQGSYLLHTALISAVLSEFHAYPLAVLPATVMIWAYGARRYFLSAISLLLLLLVQENAALVALGFGLYLLTQKSWRNGIMTVVLAGTSLLVTTKIIIPFFSPEHRYLFDNAYGSPLGNSYLEIISASLRDPRRAFETILAPSNLEYLVKIMLPTLPFALFAPVASISALVVLAPNLLSSAEILKSLSMHYEAAVLPLVYLATILGIQSTRRLFPHFFTSWLIGILILVPIVIQYKWLTSQRFSPRCIWACGMYTPRDQEIDTLLSRISPEASVATQDYLSVHLSNRPRLYLFPVAYQSVDYLALSTGDAAWPLESGKQQAYIRALRTDPAYHIVYESAHYILFAKSASIN